MRVEAGGEYIALGPGSRSLRLSVLRMCGAGTLRQVCRPTDNQESIYNGKDRYHCLKYQGTVTPDGIVVAMGGMRLFSLFSFLLSVHPVLVLHSIA